MLIIYRRSRSPTSSGSFTAIQMILGLSRIIANDNDNEDNKNNNTSYNVHNHYNKKDAFEIDIDIEAWIDCMSLEQVFNNETYPVLLSSTLYMLPYMLSYTYVIIVNPQVELLAKEISRHETHGLASLAIKNYAKHLPQYIALQVFRVRIIPYTPYSET